MAPEPHRRDPVMKRGYHVRWNRRPQEGPVYRDADRSRENAGDVAARERAERGAAIDPETRARRSRSGPRVLRSRAVRLRVATADDDAAGELSGDRAGADPPQAWRTDQNESARCTKVGRAAPGGIADRGTAADAGGGGRSRLVPSAGRCPRGFATESSSIGEAAAPSGPALHRP